MADFIIGFLCELFFDGLAVASMQKLFKNSMRKAILFIALGVFAGLFSLSLYPFQLLKSLPLQILNLFLTPTAIAYIIYLADRRINKNKEKQLYYLSFIFAFLFMFSLELIRLFMWRNFSSCSRTIWMRSRTRLSKVNINVRGSVFWSWDLLACKPCPAGQSIGTGLKLFS